MFKKIKIISCTCDNEIKQADGSLRKCPAYCFVSSRKELELKNEGWMITRDGRSYCPDCAPFYRHVGRSGKPRKYVQIKIEVSNGRRE